MSEIGGEITGQEEFIDHGVYHVSRDIVVHPTGRLTVAFGLTLRFDHSLGTMIGGELVAEGSTSTDGGITFLHIHYITNGSCRCGKQFAEYGHPARCYHLW